MQTIKNSDYSVGYVTRLNQYQMDMDEAQKYRYHQLTMADTYGGKYKHGAKKGNWKEVKATANDVLNTPEIFNSKIQLFLFSPPSDNLWNVTFELSTFDIDSNPSKLQNYNKSINQLYQNILAVNSKWSEVNAEPWAVNMGNVKTTSKKSVQEDYLGHFANDSIGVFLAQRVGFTPISLNIDGNPFGEIQQHGGFYKNGKVVKSRNDTDRLKINFLISNWDITEVLIEPWIAAIAQHGLIADEINLKAKIIVTEYSSSHEKFTDNEEYAGTMTARKQYIFDNCFPISRETPEKIYETDEAGKYKTSIVEFAYDYYTINYKF